MWEHVIEHLRQALPAEGCGLLAGSGPLADGQVAHFFLGANELNSPSRFRMAGSEVIAALKAIREQELWLAAIVHSHPSGPATPSRTDLREAFYPGAVLLIVDLSGELPIARAWDVHSGPVRTAREVPIRLE